MAEVQTVYQTEVKKESSAPKGNNWGVVLSMFWPGVGQALQGKPWGIIAFICHGAISIWFLTSFLQWNAASVYSRARSVKPVFILPLLLMMGVWVACVLDAMQEKQ
jgi:hypothetical protein